jgi:hypothetical protein
MLKKYILFICFLAAINVNAQSETSPPEEKGYTSITLSGTHDFVVGGFVYIKESYLPADTLSFNQGLRMSHWTSAAIMLSHTFKSRSSINLSAEDFFFDGAVRPNRVVFYNSLVLNGYQDMVIDKSRLFRVQFKYQHPLTKAKSDFQLYYDVGAIYDALFFRIDAKVLNDGDHSHLTEDFDDQVIPYPMLGAKAELYLNKAHASSVYAEATGSFAPESFKFYHRTGEIDYTYYSLNTALGYHLRCRHLFLSPKISYRLLNAKEDEGGHNFYISAGGISLDVGWRF